MLATGGQREAGDATPAPSGLLQLESRGVGGLEGLLPRQTRRVAPETVPVVARVVEQLVSRQERQREP